LWLAFLLTAASFSPEAVGWRRGFFSRLGWI
jgi:hypothetical protein